MRLPILVLIAALGAHAEIITLTLKQATALALEQSPELLLARLDEQKVQLEVAAVSEPLLPRIVVGSGLAYTYGMPMSVEGSAPTIITARAIRSVYDPVKKQQAAQMRELSRGQQLSTAASREEVLARIASLFLDLERYDRSLAVVEGQRQNLERIAEVVKLRAAEGREQPIEVKKAELDVARGRQRTLAYQNARTSAGLALASALGFKLGDEVRPAAEEREEWTVPESVEAGIRAGLESSFSVRKLESDLVAKNFEAKSYRAGRYPRFDLIAQYGLLAQFNNYQDYFRKFTRNNFEFGVSIQVPLFGNAAGDAHAAQAGLDAHRIRFQIQDARNRISASTRRAWDKLREAEAAREVARLDLDVARQQVTDLLSLIDEGKASLRQLEEARFQEGERWLLLYDARSNVERARLDLLKETSQVTAVLR